MLDHLDNYPNLKVLLKDFCEKLENLPNHRNSWLYKALNSSERKTLEFLEKLDDTGKEIIHAGQSDVLKTKFAAILDGASKYEINYELKKPNHDYRFLDVVAEIISFKYLSEKGCENIEFIPQFSEKTPDLKASKSGKIILMECKNCHSSNEEMQDIKSRLIKAKDVKISDALIKKLRDKICDGRKQLNEYEGQQLSIVPGDPCQKIIFLQITFDSSTMVDFDSDMREEMKQILNTEKQLLRQENISLVIISNYKIEQPFID